MNTIYILKTNNTNDTLEILTSEPSSDQIKSIIGKTTEKMKLSTGHTLIINTGTSILPINFIASGFAKRHVFGDAILYKCS